MSFSRSKVQRFSDIPKIPALTKESSGSTTAIRAKSSNSPRPSNVDRKKLTARSRSSGEENVGNTSSLAQQERNESNLVATSEVFKDAIDLNEDVPPSEGGKKPPVSGVPSVEIKKVTSGIPLPKRSSTSKSSVNKPIINTGSFNCSKPNSASSACRSPAIHTLELQFKNKKRRLDVLKKELASKQKPILDLYQSLVELKKKLEEDGVIADVEEFSFVVESTTDAKKVFKVDAGGEESQDSKKPLDPQTVKEMKKLLSKIPNSSVDFIRQLINKRVSVLNLLEQLATGGAESENLKVVLDCYKSESQELRASFEALSNIQEKEIGEITDFFKSLLENGGVAKLPYLGDSPEGEVQTLREKLRQREEDLAKAKCLLRAVQEELVNKSLPDEELVKSKGVIADLKEKNKHLHAELERERSANVDQKSKVVGYDSKFRSLKNRNSELESKNKDNEGRINELQKKLRQIQDSLRTKELQWAKEKDEHVKNIKAQETLIQKMTSDRTHFETRLRAVDEVLSEKEKQANIRIDRLTQELEVARNEAIQWRLDTGAMQKQCAFMEEQMMKIGVRNRQTIDIVAHRSDCPMEEFTTERESEMYTELLAARVDLKDYEDKIRMYEKEKLRFIATIEKLNDNSENNQASLGQALAKQEEKISRYEDLIKESDAIIAEKSMYIASLEAEVRNMKQRLETMVEENERGSAQDLKKIVHEGKVKLNESMKKNLEYEQRVIHCEHDLERQARQISEMENLLKVRDGLIGMIKAKKDELLNENESLKDYVDKLRNLLVEARDDLRARTEMIEELSVSVDNKGKMCHKLEKRIRELEGTLSVTNEKRFKLQDTIGTMEKELQNTKAHINQMADTHTRSFFYTLVSMTPPSRLANDLLRASIEDVNSITKRLGDLTNIRPSSNTLSSDRHSLLNFPEDYRNRDTRPSRHFKEFIEHVNNISEHETKHSTSSRSHISGRYYSSTAVERIKSILIAKVNVSHSLLKVRKELAKTVSMNSKFPGQ